MEERKLNLSRKNENWFNGIIFFPVTLKVYTCTIIFLKPNKPNKVSSIDHSKYQNSINEIRLMVIWIGLIKLKVWVQNGF